MEERPPSQQPLQSSNGVAEIPFADTPLSTSASEAHNGDMAVGSTADYSNPMVQNSLSSSNSINTKKKKNKKALVNISAPSSSSSSSSSPVRASSLLQRGMRVSNKRRNPKLIMGWNRRGNRDVEAIALPVGMSIAAVVAQVLERQDVSAEKMSVDYLSMICTLAVRESLANVFGDKFVPFVENFEKSFRSTLRTLRLISDSAVNREGFTSSHLSVENSASNVSLNNEGGSMSSCVNNRHFEAVSPSAGTRGPLCTLEEVQENTQTYSTNLELALHGQINQQLACVSPSTTGSFTNHSVLRTFEKSVTEQTRANDLKTVEINLLVKRMELEQAKYALDSNFNLLERFKLSMGMSKASFKAEKYKNQLEETRYAELLKQCIDCLVGGLLIVSSSLAYGAYVHSYKRIAEATSSCYPQKESKSWFLPNPMASFNSGLHSLLCHIQVGSRMLFGLLMIVLIALLLLQRSGNAKHTMPVTFIVLILGIACGTVGKLCVDTLGGNGYIWALYWESICLLHFLSNVFTSALFFILHGPITVAEGLKGSKIFPYWMRRFLFYSALLLFLPILCGLMPFASFGEWKNHFSLKIAGFLAIANDRW